MSRAAELSLMKFCMNMYLDNFYKSVEFQSHTTKVKVTWFLCVFCLHDICGQYLACLGHLFYLLDNVVVVCIFVRPLVIVLAYMKSKVTSPVNPVMLNKKNPRAWSCFRNKK